MAEAAASSPRGLDPASLILVRLAALIAMVAPPASYLLHIGPAIDSGVTLEQAQDVLVEVAPIVGHAAQPAPAIPVFAMVT